jgi:hypothetical protein
VSGARWLASLLALWAALAMLGAWQAIDAAQTSVAAQLRAILPQRIAAAGINRVAPGELTAYLAAHIDADLSRIRPAGPLSLVSHCSARVLAADGGGPATRWPPTRLVILLGGDAGEHDQPLALESSCAINRPRWLGSQLLLAAAALALIRIIPVPLSRRRRTWLQRLIDSGVEPRRGRRLTRHLDGYPPLRLQLADRLYRAMAGAGIEAATIMEWLEDPRLAGLDASQTPWFELGLGVARSDVDQALQIATAPPTLVLDPAESTIWCHGVPVRLSPTQFFYYYWYAQRRVAGIDDGWFANPPANRPDIEAAQQLIVLMECHDGHAKAVKDLRDKGLRAKTLDQNRSKVKEELVGVLGESLAAGYLFEMARDPRTGRCNYRLAVPPGHIALPARVLQPADNKEKVF